MRWILRSVAALLSVVVLAVGALFLIPAERLANLAAERFEVATGRALVIEGSVRPSLFPVLGARIEGVRVANADWSDAGPLLSAEAVDLGVDLAALWGGDLVIRRFEARNPRILLERHSDGRGNWELSAAPAAESGARAPLSLPILERAEIIGADLRFIDHASGQDLRLSALDLTLALPQGGGGAADLAARGRIGQQQAALSATIASADALLNGQVSALRAELTTGGARAAFDGRLSLSPLALDGRFDARTEGLQPILALLGQSGEPLPAAARPLSAQGQITLAPEGSLHLRQGALGLGANRLALELDLSMAGERPLLSGEISADALDLSPFMAGGGSGGGGAGGWSQARIDASALALLDARLGLTLGPLRTGVVDLDAFRGSLTIDRARAVLGITEARLYGGRLAGEAVANNRSGLSVGGTLNAEGVQLLGLLRQLAGMERLTGTASAQLRFLGSGNSLDAIMRSLSGEGALRFADGAIIGLDLLGMLRTLDMSYMGEGNRTVFNAITGSFTINGGVLSNSDLRMEAPLLSVDGRGQVNLGAQTLDYRVIPAGLNDGAGNAIRVPLLITGPWAAPRFRLDLEGMAEERLREEAARLEARAREELQRLEAEARAQAEAEAARALGIERREGQSLEDAAREGLESEIQRGLMRLLAPPSQ